MKSDLAFDVLSILTCDYAAQDSEGKQILIGVHDGPVYTLSMPPSLPAWYITVVMKPKAKDFTFKVDFDAPDSRRILRMTCTFSAETDLADDNRLVTAIQLPTIPFPGFGDYNIRVRNERSETVMRHTISLRSGRGVKPNINLDVVPEINPDFTGKSKLRLRLDKSD